MDKQTVNSMKTTNTAEMDRKTLQERFKIDLQKSHGPSQKPSTIKDFKPNSSFQNVQKLIQNTASDSQSPKKSACRKENKDNDENQNATTSREGANSQCHSQKSKGNQLLLAHTGNNSSSNKVLNIGAKGSFRSMIANKAPALKINNFEADPALQRRPLLTNSLFTPTNFMKPRAFMPPNIHSARGPCPVTPHNWTGVSSLIKPIDL